MTEPVGGKYREHDGGASCRLSIPHCAEVAELGRRAGLRSLWGKPRGGSNPPFRTTPHPGRPYSWRLEPPFLTRLIKD